MCTLFQVKKGEDMEVDIVWKICECGHTVRDFVVMEDGWGMIDGDWQMIDHR